jgi:hypothetical protein
MSCSTAQCRTPIEPFHLINRKDETRRLQALRLRRSSHSFAAFSMIAHAARSSSSAANWSALIKSSYIKVSVQPRTDCVELIHDLSADNAISA